jgi:signal transduction histidine kinase
VQGGLQPVRAHAIAGPLPSPDQEPTEDHDRTRRAPRDRYRLPASDNRWVTAVAAAALTFTALVLLVPALTFAYPLPVAAAFIATLTSVSALVVAVLFFQRYRRTGAALDLLIAIAMSMTACIEAVMPLVGQLDSWSATVALESRTTGRGAVAILMCLAAWLPSRPMRRPWSPVLFSAVVLGLAGVIVGLGYFGAHRVPVAIRGSVVEDGGVALARSPGVLIFRLVGAVLLAFAAWGFSRKAIADEDGLLTWVAMGAVLLCIARFHDFLFPSTHSDWLTTADMLRLTGQEILMVGALFEMGGWWRQRASDATQRERKRLARELHDGLAQELAFLSSHAIMVSRAGSADERSLHQLIDAAERALVEARSAIEELSQGGDARVDRAVASAGHEIAERYDIEICFDLDPIELDPRASQELTRLAGEAMLNAVRHGAPRRVDVRMRCTKRRISVLVVDDGHGFDWDAPSDGFGLTSMRERAARLGGSCVIESSPGGTEVRVEVPFS